MSRLLIPPHYDLDLDLLAGSSRRFWFEALFRVVGGSCGDGGGGVAVALRVPSDFEW